MKINSNNNNITFDKKSVERNEITTIETDIKNIKGNINTINLQIETITDQAEKLQLNLNTLLRIDDEVIADNTVWSSSKINEVIVDSISESNSHIHNNKDVIDNITEVDIANWNNKSEFDGNYRSLIDKPSIPSMDNLKLIKEDNIIKLMYGDLELSSIDLGE